MKVLCPICSTHVPTANLCLSTGWAKCSGCEEIFSLEDVVPGFSAEKPRLDKLIARPYNARAILDRTDSALLIHVPAEGMRATTWGLLGFATFWLGFVTFWTLGALGVFFGQQPGAWNWGFAAFSIPFWLVGFGMVGTVVWSATGRKTIRIDAEGMGMEWRCLAGSRTRWIEIDRVQYAREYEPQVRNSRMRTHGVEIVYRKGSFVLPTDSRDEQRWLISEINGFLKSSTGSGK